jgi:uncharacterized membrane protein
MVDAWSAEPDIKDADAKKARAKALEEAADNFFDAYIRVAGVHGVIPYIHHVSNMLILFACHTHSSCGWHSIYHWKTLHMIMMMFLVTLWLLITLYYLRVAFHFPKWMEEHSSLNVFSAQGMEHSNTKTK